MNKTLEKIFENEEKEMNLAFEKAKIGGKGTPQEISDRTENIFNAFLSKYFPFPFRIVKGNINDSFNFRSGSIDCIILNPCHPYTVDEKSQKSSFVFAEGVDFVIEIKSSLNNQEEIERSLEQIKKVKMLRKVRDKKEEYLKTIPCIIYANKTYSNKLQLLKKVSDYYKDNGVEELLQVDLIVLGDGVIINHRPNSYTPFVTELYYALYGEKEIMGRGLVFYEVSSPLAFMLLFMSKVPLSTLRIEQDVLSFYLKPKIKYTFIYNQNIIGICNDKSIEIYENTLVNFNKLKNIM